MHSFGIIQEIIFHFLKKPSTQVSHTGVNHQALNPMDDKGYLYGNYNV